MGRSGAIMTGSDVRSFPPAGNAPLSEVEKIRRTIEAGHRLCEMDGTKEPKKTEVVWRLFREAADTYRRLPDREIGWLLAGNRVAWPDVVHDGEDKKQAQEQYEVELARVQSGQDPVEALRLRDGPPDRGAIGRADVVSGWRQYLAGNDQVRDWKILWLLASDRLSARIVAKECRCSTRTVWRRWEFQLRVLAQRVYEVR